MSLKNIIAFFGAIVIAQLAGIIGTVFTASSITTWYNTLVRPNIAPPNWIFAPVWIALFTLMGIASFLIWRKGFQRGDVRVAIMVYGFQLVLNSLWSIIFFGLRSPSGAFIEIIVLWLGIAASIVIFYKISKPSAWLLVPYIIWVSFAAYLNYQIWQLNL